MKAGTQGFTEAERETEAEQKYARSDLVYGAQAQLPDRYRLCRFAALATRRLHKSSDRIQDTINDVLVHLGEPQTQTGLLATAPLETRLKNVTWMPVSQAAFTPEGRGV